MIRTRREKILATLAAAAVTVALLLESGFELPLHPFADLDLALTEATAQAEEHQVQVNRLLHDLQALEDAAKRSLPADPGRASALYQAWLVQQLTNSGIEAASVNPSTPITDEFLGYRIPVSIECDAPAAAIAEFIDRFSSTPLLHRLTNVQIVNSSSGFDDHHRLAVTIEALALPTAPEVDVLPEPDSSMEPETTLASLFENSPLLTLPQPPAPPQLPEPQAVAETTPAGQPVTDTTAPVEPAVPADPPKPPTPPAPKYSPGQSLQFIGSILSGETRRAWFVDRRSGDEYFAAASEDITVPELTVKILTVTDDSVTVLYKSRRVRMRLGQTAALPPAPFRRKQSATAPPPDAGRSTEVTQPVTALE